MLCKRWYCYLHEKSDLYNDNVEALWIEINLPQTKPLLLGTVYRAPDSKAEYIDKLDFLFQNYTSLYDDVVIVGDFNLDLCKTSNNTKVNKLASHCNMKQFIDDYTRITEATKSFSFSFAKLKTILDLAFVTNRLQIPIMYLTRVFIVVVSVITL